MPAARPFDLPPLRAGIAGMYASIDRESAQIRAAHLGTVLRLTPWMMAANVANGALVLWAFRARLEPALWLWWATLMLVSGLALMNSWRRRHRAPAAVSTHAVHRATAHAALLAGVWAALPLGWLAGATPPQQLLLATLVTGMLGAGTFVLSPLPLASAAYAAIFTVASLVSLAMTGEPMFLAVAGLLLLYALMSVLGALGMWRKATQSLVAQATAQRQEQMLAVLLQDFEQHAGEALWETGPDGRLVHVSPRLAEMLALDAAAAQARTLTALLAERSPDGAVALQQAFDAGRNFRALALELLVGSATRHLSLNGKCLHDELGRIRGWRGVLADVTEKVRAERDLWQLAHTDSLTGLANRFTLRDALAEQLRQRRGGALLSLDLDHFKTVNDTLGHSAGDELLRAVAGRLRACVRPGDLVARLGGDEFAVLMTHSGRAEDAAALATRLVAALDQPMDVQGRRLPPVRGSVGVALCDDDEVGVDELLLRADTALYAAKEGGRGRYVLYEMQLGERTRRQLAIETGLRQAVQQGQLALHWQPKVDIAHWRIVGAEALMRWRHPELGQVGPGEFIPVAERVGLIDELGTWALHEACRAAAGPLAGLVVSVNVSRAQLRDGQLAGRVREALHRYQLEPQWLELEITESLFADDAAAMLAHLHALRALGVRIALDDFGTEYSSLQYLLQFRFDTLKIDRAFVNEVLHRQEVRAVVQTIAQLAVALDMRTVCEGVETPQQLAAVAQAGCDEMQGFLASAPRALDDFQRLRRNWRPMSPMAVALH